MIVGNILWFLLGGAITGLLWCVVGLAWSITIIGIPVGKQCFKFAQICFMPFGKSVIHGGKTPSLLMNVLWICFGGIELAVQASTLGLLFCITIIGIPFGKQYFKIAQLALMPFGSMIV